MDSNYTGSPSDNATEPSIDPLRRVVPPLDPLKRVFIPIERVMSDGDWRLRTSDRTRYTRSGKTGAIFRADPKPLNKHAKRRARAACQ